MRKDKHRQHTGSHVGRRLMTFSPFMPMSLDVVCLDDTFSLSHSYTSSEPIASSEASKMRLICGVCQRFLATGQRAPTLPELLDRTFHQEKISPALSWIVAEGLQHWIKQQTIPGNLWTYTRCLLLERLAQQKRVPKRVVLEVEVRHGGALLQSTTRFLGAGSYSSNLLETMRHYSCEHWRPLCECFGTHTPVIREQCPGEQAARLVGLRWDPELSQAFSLALQQAYGPFTLEWLCSAEKLF